MKPHFSKLLTEKERRGSRNRSAKYHLSIHSYDPDQDYDFPSRAPMSRNGMPYGYDGKELSDVLGPLKGWLRKNIGRPWNAVYSEACRNLDRRSVSGNHVFQHLMDYVETNCWIGAETGKVYSNGRRGPTEVWRDYYVHPWTGLLCKAPDGPSWRRRYPRTAPDDTVKISDNAEYKQIDGIWYYTEFTWVKLYYGGYQGKWRVDDTGRVVGGWNRRGEMEQVIQKKRQLSKKELRGLKLRNSLPQL